MSFSERPIPQDQPPAGPLESHPNPDAAPVEARGLGWVIVPALLGLVFGALIGLVMATNPRPPRLGLLESAIQGGIVGAIAGTALGVFIWVAFPYKNAPPPPPSPEGEEQDSDGAIV
ncbi:MAG TPA: hypothetical protein VEL76_30845 [Gemmataceae bacterium]|nr:hypothetical protein [Gemmataceae bacterium]